MVHEQWTDSGEPYEADGQAGQADHAGKLDQMPDLEDLRIATKELNALNAEEAAIHLRQAIARQQLTEAWHRHKGLQVDFSAENVLDHMRWGGGGDYEMFDGGSPTIIGNGSMTPIGTMPFDTYNVYDAQGGKVYFIRNGDPTVRSVRVDDVGLESPQPPPAA